MLNIECGVTQGSILGSLFFIIYINDFFKDTPFRPIMFADDTNVFYSHQDIKAVILSC